jgi:hypothetical protein
LLPSLSELVGILRFDPVEHESIWQFAIDGPVPNVTLDVKALYGETGASESITFKVDTGAFTSTLSEKSTVDLEIDRTLRNGEVLRLACGLGAGGQTIVGVHRWISIGLGGVYQQIPVLVPPDLSDQEALDKQRKQDGLPMGLPPRSNLLGMAQIFGNYLLCLDQDNLYAFRDIFSRRQRYFSKALSKFRGR